MNDTLTLALVVSGMSLLLILFIAVIIFVCTYHVGIYKSFKKPVKTMGIIDDVQSVTDEDGDVWYTVTYSYTDNGGVRCTNTFKWLQNIGKAGDKLALHYDSQNPQNSIADCQLNYGKNLWWKVLIVLAVIIVPAVFCGIYFGK